MKILYGVQGTGNGHITRARAMAKALQQANLEVDFLFSGRPADQYYDMEIFGDFRCYPGLSLGIQQGSVSYIHTLRQARPIRLVKDCNDLQLNGYDLVISDFEPLSAWAARRAGIPSVGLGHQYAFQYDIPKGRHSITAAAVMNYFAPVDYPLGLHWHHFNAPLLPPLVVSPQDLPGPITDAGTILVYLPFESQERVIQLLQNWPQYRFHLFTNDMTAGNYQNIEVHPQSRDGFQRQLLRCSGVICNAGFELISEALCLGKKILARPLAKQMEQLANAAALEQLKLAQTMTELSAEKIEQWLRLGKQITVCYPHVANRLTDWLCHGELEASESLARALWAETHSPQYPANFFCYNALESWPLMSIENEVFVTRC